MEMIMLEISL